MTPKEEFEIELRQLLTLHNHSANDRLCHNKYIEFVEKYAPKDNKEPIGIFRELTDEQYDIFPSSDEFKENNDLD